MARGPEPVRTGHERAAHAGTARGPGRSPRRGGRPRRAAPARPGARGLPRRRDRARGRDPALRRVRADRGHRPGLVHPRPTPVVLARTAAVAAIGLAVFSASSPCHRTACGRPWGCSAPIRTRRGPRIRARDGEALVTAAGARSRPALTARVFCGAHLLGGAARSARGPRSGPSAGAGRHLYTVRSPSLRRNYNALLLGPAGLRNRGLLVRVLAHLGPRPAARLGRARCLACVLGTPPASWPSRGLPVVRVTAAAWRPRARPGGPSPSGRRAGGADGEPVAVVGGLRADGALRRPRWATPCAAGPGPSSRWDRGRAPRVAPPLPGFDLIHDGFNREWPSRPPLLRYFLEEDYSFAVYRPRQPQSGAP